MHQLRNAPPLLAMGFAALFLPVSARAVVTVTCSQTAAEVGVSYTATCNAAGGLAPYTWMASAGTPSAAVTVTVTGLDTATVTGTPLNADSGRIYSFTVQATDSTPVTPVSGTSLPVMGTVLASPAVSCSNANAPPSIAGLLYNSTCTAVGGSGVYTSWAVVGGALPAGVTGPSLPNGATTGISGTPATAGQVFSYSVQVTDSNGGHGAVSFSGSIAAPLSVVCTPAVGTVETGLSYTVNCAPTGGVGLLHYSISAGAPTGPVFNVNTGQLSGLLTGAGPYSFSIQVQDSMATPQVASSLVIQGSVTARPSITCNGPAAGPTRMGIPYDTLCIVTGGTPPFTWSAAGLPPGLLTNVANNGMSFTIFGTPSTPGTFPYTVSTTDSATVPQMSNAIAFPGVIAAGLTVNCGPSLTTAEVGVQYSITCTAANDPTAGSFTWTTTGTLPNNVVMTPSVTNTITFTGTPSVSGGFGFSVIATDNSNPPQTASHDISGQVVAAPVATCTMPSGQLELTFLYTATCSVTGGTPPYNWRTVTGALPVPVPFMLPAGLGLAPAAGATTVISGTPTTVTPSFSYEVQVTDSASTPQSAPLLAFNNQTINAAFTMSCSQNSRTNEVGVLYTTVCTANGGYPPYVWAISSGSVPPGLSTTQGGPMNNTLTISGSPIAPSNLPFTVQVSDGRAGALPIPSVVTPNIIDKPSVTCDMAAGPFETGVPYSTICTAAGGTPPYNWTTAPLALPAGLSLGQLPAPLGNKRMISGTPTATGNYSYLVQVTDSAVDATGTAAPQMPPAAVLFSGTISGLTMSCVTALPAISNNAGPAQVGVPYSATCIASGGTPPYMWATVAPGSPNPPNSISQSLPDGITFSASGADATISGTPAADAAGNYSYSIQVTDSATGTNGPAHQTAPLVPYSGTIKSGISLTCFATNVNAPIQPTEVGVPYSATCTVDVPATPLDATHATGTPNYTYSILGQAPVTITCGLVPCGGVATPNTFVTIAGIPTGAGVYSYKVKVTDGAPQPQTAQVAFTVNIAPPPTVTCTSYNGPTEANIAYSDVCTVTGGTPPYVWSIASPDGSNGGFLPSGIVLTQTSPGITASIAGTAQTAGPYQYAVQVTDSSAAPQSALSQTFIGSVLPAVGITCTNSNVPLEVNVPYTNTCKATGGTPPYTFSVQGTAVAGITLSAPSGSSTATLSGSPTSPQAFNYTIQVTDNATPPGSASSAPYKGPVADSPTVICDQRFGPSQLQAVYLTTCTAKSGLAPYTFSISGALPPGIRLNNTAMPNVVTLSGMATQSGAYSYAVVITDANAGTAQQAFSPTVTPILTLTVGQPAGDFSVKGKGGTFTLNPVSNSGNITGPVIVSVGPLPPGLTVSAISSTDVNWTCSLVDSQGNASCTRSDNPPMYTPITVTVTVTDPVCVNPSTVSLSPSISLNGFTQFSTPVAIQPTGCLVITKSHQGSFPVAGNGSYTITVNNPTTQTISGPITVSDTLNSLLSVDTAFQTAQPNWNCTATVAGKIQQWTISCTYTGGPVAPGSTLPTIAVPVDVGQITAGQTACGLVTDPASVFLTTVHQFDATDATSIAGPGCVFIRGVFNAAVMNTASPPQPVANPLCLGTASNCYNITVANVGEGVLSDPVSLTLTLPLGFSYAGEPAASPWQCALDPAGLTVTCTLSPPAGSASTLDGGAYSVLTLGVNIDQGAFPCGVQSAALSGTQGANPLTLASIPSSVAGGSCLGLTRSYAAAKVQAGVQSSYTLTVTNPAGTPVTGPAISVTETLPAGVALGTQNGALPLPSWDDGVPCTATQDSGSGLWTLTCARTDDIPAAGTAYHAINVPFVASTVTCPGLFSTAFLYNNNAAQPLQSSTTDIESMTGCFSLTRAVAPGGFTLGDTGTYTLTAAYLGQMPVYGQITVTDTLNPGLTPTPMVPVNAGWSCVTTPFSSTQAQPYSLSCTRPAVGTFTPISETVTVDANACSTATSSATLAASIAGGVIQSNSLPQDQTSIAAGSGGACPVGQLSAVSASSSGVLTPNLQGVTYTITVTNSGMSATDGVSAVVVTDIFPPGVTPNLSQINQQGWDCGASTGLILSCMRSDGLPAMASYPPISVPVMVTAAACPTATDKVTLTLGNKNQGVPYLDPVQLQGCLTVSPQSVVFPTAALSAPAPQQVVSITATDKSALNLFFSPPATGDFAYSCPTCTATPCPAGMQCAVLSNGQQVQLNVTYQPACIGTSNDFIQYSTSANPGNMQSISLMGSAALSSYTFMLLPSSGNPQGLSNGFVVNPAQSLNLGLNPASPGYCTGGSQRVTASLSPQLSFTPNGSAIPLQVYDETINLMCPSGITGCIGILGTGTVAGDITVSAAFNDTVKGPVVYPGAPPSVTLTVPLLPPVLTNVGKGTVTASSFEIAVTGYSTPRAGTQACFAFNAAPGAVLNTGDLNKCYAMDQIDIWFSRSGSVKTGSMFETTVTFSFAGVADAIGNVDVKLNNALGDSQHYCMDFKSGTAKPGACQ